MCNIKIVFYLYIIEKFIVPLERGRGVGLQLFY